MLAAERPLIASVFRNRLRDDMPLQADPTVQYAISVRPGSVTEFGFWKRDLSLQDLQFDSTYNTYTRKGLPPGPIGQSRHRLHRRGHPAGHDQLPLLRRTR